MANQSGSPDDRMLPRPVSPYEAATKAVDRRQLFEAEAWRRPEDYDDGITDDDLRARARLLRRDEGMNRRFPGKEADDLASAGADAAGGFDIKTAVANVIYELMKPTRDRLFETVQTPTQPADVDMSGAKSAAVEADQAGRQIERALSVSATPQVDTSQIDAAIAKANTLTAALSRANASTRTANASFSREMNRNFTDHGVRR